MSSERGVTGCGMLDRRSMMMAGFWALITGGDRGLDKAPLAKTPVAFAVPAGACDSHVHVIGELNQFPMSSEREYTPPPATADELRKQMQLLKIDRVVVVTPDVYATNNSATLAAIEHIGRDRARGVARVDERTPPETFSSMRSGGIEGIRLSLSPTTRSKYLEDNFELAMKNDWHAQIMGSPEVIASLLPQLSRSPVPLVIDTFGWAQGGIEENGFDALLSLVRSGQAYVKLSEPYRLSKKKPDYADLAPVVKALLTANEDRLLWGSGWPYVSGPQPNLKKNEITPDLPMDAGELLNLFAAWVPDARLRQKILVDNPAKLYRF
jgi:predicted TIM-barrel fold metal-dependent hydrolase